MTEKHVIKVSAIMNFFKDEEKLVSKGENAVESGHVKNMVFDASMRIVKGVVHASMRDKEYQVEICFTDEFNIEKSHCSCPRGQFLCHHMAALALFSREHVSVTDKECVWNIKKSTDQEKVQSIEDIFPPQQFRATQRDLTSEEVESFREKLKIFDGAVGFSWLLSPEVNLPSDIVVSIEDTIFCSDYHLTVDKIKYISEKLKVNPEKIIEVANLTVGQANNEMWLICRKHRLTASHFAAVLNACKKKRFSPSLFKRLIGAYNLDHIKAIQWGREHEKEGIKALEDSLNVKVVPTGLWLHECGYLGASPDGLIGEDCLVEVKCPFKYRSRSMLEDIKHTKNYIIHSDPNGEIIINREHDYFYQIQGQLAITKRKKCHLVIWTPIEVVLMIVEAESFNEEIEIIQNFYLEQYITFINKQ